ncbi:MAG TPA: recombinase family protein [Candidatus Merdibacter merdigallinarum]|nr:recombinase family protein [Candidatus Merdibacter merdigallinarum]
MAKPALEKSVREIAADPRLTQRSQKRLRVAAYCRVSTELEEQESSFEGQVSYYTDKIESNPEWEMAGIYADHGISGVKDTTRPGFMQMIEDCKQHKIDMILTKSLSRFSRNTLDSIRYIRLLKSLGVVIVFEKEGLNTGELGSEIYLTWFSAFAQAESESLSQNVTMGKRRLYKEGKCSFQYKHFIGYRRGADGQPEVDPEGAKTIEHIYYGFLAGKTPAQLKTELEQKNIRSPSGNATWSKATIQNILRNEKYAGDVLLQKTFTADFLTKKVKKNRGELAQYYVTDNHPAIIPREIFQQVQLELARRSSRPKISQRKSKTEQGKYTSKFALSERLVCGECGCMYRRTQWVKRDGTKEHVWRCINRLECGKKYCKHSPSMKEPELQKMIMDTIRPMFTDSERVRAALIDVERKIALQAADQQNAAAVITRIQEIDQAMSNLLLLVSHSADSSIYYEKFKQLSKEKSNLQAQLKVVGQAVQQDEERKRQLQTILDTIEHTAIEVNEYDDDLVRRIIEKITVMPDGQLTIRFKSGLQA